MTRSRDHKITRSHDMDIVFCGTPQFAVPTLEALLENGFNVRLVVTQPDRPRGRGLLTAPSAIKQLALERGLPVTQPETIRNNPEFRARLEQIQPQAIVVVAYGRILPNWMLDLPPLGNINLHASLLPKYRGAAPIQWAIARGETVTGVTTMRIDAGLDTGDIVLQREVPILPEDTAETLAPRLAAIGAPLMVETLRGLKAGTTKPVPQDNASATVAPIIKREDGLIDFTRPATEIANRLRGFQPWPGVFTKFRGKNLHLWQLKPLSSGPEAVALGEIKVEGVHLYAGCGGKTMLEILEVQPEGKKRMRAQEFVNGYRPRPGEKFGAE
ncbi:MAG: methionyl-tRNA formyltransferase [Terriglobales bacterium]